MSDPGWQSEVRDVLRSQLPARLFTQGVKSLDVADKVRNDPLRVLPYDLLLDIFGYLSTNDILSLMTSSWHILNSTREASFWQHMLRRRVLPWFWELTSVLESTTFPDGFDHKGLFLWLHTITQPQFGLYGPMMGIANRRRIWRVCQELRPLYKARVKPVQQVEPADDEAKEILDRAVNLHLPIVTYPQTKDAQTTFTQFIRSWHEIRHRSCELQTYWNEQSILVGIAVTFGGPQRLFGSTLGKPGLPLHIDAGDWIQEIRVSIDPLDMMNEHQNRSDDLRETEVIPFRTSSITGMQVSQGYGAGDCVT